MAQAKQATRVQRTFAERTLTNARVQGALLEDAWEISGQNADIVSARLEETREARAAAISAEVLRKMGL